MHLSAAPDRTITSTSILITLATLLELALNHISLQLRHIADKHYVILGLLAVVMIEVKIADAAVAGYANHK